MDVSLRIYSRSIADSLDIKVGDLYNLQRGLVEAGLLNPERPGPGGGTRATADTIAKLLVARLWCTGRSNAAEIARSRYEMDRARDDRGQPDPLFQTTHFGAFIEAALSNPHLCQLIKRIEVDRKSKVARVEYYTSPALEEDSQDFFYYAMSASSRAGHRGWYYELSVLEGLLLQKIAEELDEVSVD